MGIHNDYHIIHSVVRQGTNDFVAGTFTIGTTADSEYACWFRIYNENASFGGGGGSSSDLSGVPHQMAFFNTSAQLVGTPLAEVSGNQVLFGDGISGEPIIAFLNHQTDGIFWDPSGINERSRISYCCERDGKTACRSQ